MMATHLDRQLLISTRRTCILNFRQKKARLVDLAVEDGLFPLAGRGSLMYEFRACQGTPRSAARQVSGVACSM